MCGEGQLVQALGLSEGSSPQLTREPPDPGVWRCGVGWGGRKLQNPGPNFAKIPVSSQMFYPDFLTLCIVSSLALAFV